MSKKYRVNCACHRAFLVDEAVLGRTVRCPHCKRAVAVPSPSAQTAGLAKPPSPAAPAPARKDEPVRPPEAARPPSSSQSAGTISGAKVAAFWGAILLLLIAGILVAGVISRQRGREARKFLADVIESVRHVNDGKGFGGNVSVLGRVLVWDMERNCVSGAQAKLPRDLQAKLGDQPITVFMIERVRDQPIDTAPGKPGLWMVAREIATGRVVSVSRMGPDGKWMKVPVEEFTREQQEISRGTLGRYADMAVAHWPEKRGGGRCSVTLHVLDDDSGKVKSYVETELGIASYIQRVVKRSR